LTRNQGKAEEKTNRLFKTGGIGSLPKLKKVEKKTAAAIAFKMARENER